MSHPLRPTPHAEAAAAATPAPRWPSFTGRSQFVGATADGRTSVFVDPALGAPGAPGLQNAQALLADADRVTAANDALFGAPGGPVAVIVFALSGRTDGTGGADHMGCDFQTGAAIEVCAAFGQPARVSALFEAELSECSMGGRLCGMSTGEALSRWCAAQVSGNALADFATAPAWDRAGQPNWVDRTRPTDQDPIATGCGMAFLSWLLSLGHPLGSLAQGMVGLGDGGTLAELCHLQTGRPSADAWPAFQAALAALPGGIQDDDPFAGSQPPPPPPPPPPPLGGLTLTLSGDLTPGASGTYTVSAALARQARPCGQARHPLRLS